MTSQKRQPVTTIMGPPFEAGIANGISSDADLLASLPDPSLEPTALYKRIRGEPRDVDWASLSERNVRAALKNLPYASAKDLRVSCASTLCEVRGAMPNGISKENASIAMEAIQDPKLQANLASNGLQVAMTTFGGGAHGYVRTFTIYAKRN